LSVTEVGALSAAGWAWLTHAVVPRGRGWLGVIVAWQADLSGWLGVVIARKADLNWKL